MYSENTDEDPKENDEFYNLYGTVQESVYQDLTTIIPIHFFALKDFPPVIKDRFHFTHKEILEYLQNYSKHFEIEKLIKFNSTVVEVSKNSEGEKEWKVTVKI